MQLSSVFWVFQKCHNVQSFFGDSFLFMDPPDLGRGSGVERERAVGKKFAEVSLNS